MSQWHREHPELTGTDADPWMIHESYRRNVEPLVDPVDFEDSIDLLSRLAFEPAPEKDEDA